MSVFLTRVTKSVWSVLFVCAFFFGGTIAFAQNSGDEQVIDDTNDSGDATIDYEPGFPPGGGGSNVYKPPAPDLEKRLRAEDRLRAYGTDLLGDGIDPNTGSIHFSTTDVSISGNFGLPVAITRKMSQGRFYGRDVAAEFGDWQIEVPRIHVLTRKGYNWTGNRCTNTFDQSFPSHQIEPFSRWHRTAYTNGLKMDIPGQGSKDVLKSSPPNTNLWPSDTQMVTIDGWRLTCGSANSGQGFIGHSPDGTKYRFDRFYTLDADQMGSRFGGGPVMQRSRNIIAATQVTDVNGNTVNYDYDAQGRLKAIRASDGRRINLTYSGSSKLIRSVTSNPGSNQARTWTYTYANKTFPEIYNDGAVTSSLTRVTQPDTLFWTYNLGGMSADPGIGDHCPQTSQNVSVTHPHGVTGAFKIGQTFQRTSYGVQETESFNCPGITDVTPGQPIWKLKIAKIMSVSEKKLSGPNMPTQIWSYLYEADLGPVNSSGGDRTNWTKVTNPVGVETIYRHYWQAEPYGGKLASKEVVDDGSVLNRLDYSYQQENGYGLPTHTAGTTPPSVYRPTHTTKVVSLQDGDTFTSEAFFETNQNSNQYAYSRPHTTSTKSNVYQSPRTTVSTYEHNKTKWILGLLKQVTQNGRNTSSYSYDNFGRKTHEYRYGVLKAKFGYHSNASYKGALYWATDALNNRYEARNWKRGTPQILRQAVGTPDQREFRQYVDNNGWMTSSRDARSNSTSYAYDKMGRLKTVNPPGNWVNTNIAYNFNGGGAIQTITRGKAKTTVTYDPMFRSILEREQATDTGWSSYVKNSYDALGRKIFTSFPSSSSNPSSGTDFTYDGLNRIKHQQENVSPYAKTTHRYNPYHHHRVLDPSGAYTDYYYFGYDGPGSKEVRAIHQGFGTEQLRRTTLDKNIWGQLTRLVQWDGAGTHEQQFYYYDNEQRLCRYRELEGGDSLYSYYDNDQLKAYVKGQPNAAGCGTVSGTGRIDIAYDDLGRLKTTTFADPGTPDISRDYDADDNVRHVNRGSGSEAVNWTYFYDVNNQLTREELRLDSRTFKVSYAYNTSGDMTRMTYPSTRHVDFQPDGLGRARKAKYGTLNYAKNISYHPSGQVSGLQYGNGYVFTQTLNNRLLPLRILSKKNATKAVDMNFGYDARGLITSIVDGAISGNDRIYSYDALGQIETASGPWGNGSYNFDAVGNLKSYNLGSRSVTLRYDNRNRVNRSTDTGGWGGDTGTRHLGYDARGNVTSLGNTGFVYDYSDQPTVVSGSVNGNYKYDGNQKRVRSQVDGKTIYNVFNRAGQLVHIYEPSGNKKTDYIRAAGMFIASRDAAGTPTYMHTDHLGSPVRTTRANGSILSTERYSPFGITAENHASNVDQPGFTGHMKDAGTGLSYMQARYYDPVIGRFLSIDPVGFVGTYNPRMFNRYSYGLNDPVNLNDPDGKCPICVPIAIFIAKEIAAELASNATGGLSDYASVRRTGTKAARAVAAEVAKARSRRAARVGTLPRPASVDGDVTNSAEKTLKGAANPKVRAAIERGKQAHKELEDKLAAKGWDPKPSLRGADGKIHKPDVVTPNGRFMELKPNTPSGRRAGKRQANRYRKQLGMKGRVIYYDP